MNRFKLTFSTLACLLLAGCNGYYCWALCSDQTMIQGDYKNQRDRCRDYAQLKLDTNPKSGQGVDERPPKSQLVSLFAECMNKHNWSVPGAQAAEGAATATPTSAPVNAASPAPAQPAPAAVPAPNAAALAAEDRAAILRSAECNFARASASTSSIAATRARACDLECAERLKAIVDGPRPAACGGNSPDVMATGRDDVE